VIETPTARGAFNNSPEPGMKIWMDHEVVVVGRFIRRAATALTPPLPDGIG